MKAYLQAVPLLQKISEPGFMEGPRFYLSIESLFKHRKHDPVQHIFATLRHLAPQKQTAGLI
jgi:hypothetical protein